MNYYQLSQAIQSYLETTEPNFVANIPVFVQAAEERIYNTVQLPAIRRNITGYLTTGNKYLTLPTDYLATFSLAVIDPVTQAQTFLLDKDVNFIRQAYPDPTAQAVPQYFGQFAPYTLIMGPTPDQDYQVELHQYYYPPSIVQGIVTNLGSLFGGSGYANGIYQDVPMTGGSGSNLTADITVVGNTITAVAIQDGGVGYLVGDIVSAAPLSIGGTGTSFTITVSEINNAEGTSWLGTNMETALLYGAIREAVIFQKGEQDMVAYYEKMYQESLALLKVLGDGKERRSAYRDGQVRVPVL